MRSEDYSSCLVCLSVCVTANLRIHAERCQIWLPMASAGYGDDLKKVISFKMPRRKIMALFTYCNSVKGPTVYFVR